MVGVNKGPSRPDRLQLNGKRVRNVEKATEKIGVGPFRVMTRKAPFLPCGVTVCDEKGKRRWELQYLLERSKSVGPAEKIYIYIYIYKGQHVGPTTK